MILPDEASEHRRRLIASVERPCHPPHDIRIGIAVLLVAGMLVTLSMVLAATELADDIRATRRAVVRCK